VSKTGQGTLMDIYRSVYPQWRFWLACDSMKIESLGIALNKQVGVCISQWRQDIRLGEIVDCTATTI
jgi:hypothetical protein